MYMKSFLAEPAARWAADTLAELEACPVDVRTTDQMIPRRTSPPRSSACRVRDLTADLAATDARIAAARHLASARPAVPSAGMREAGIAG